jgi:hypothetical protein
MWNLSTFYLVAAVVVLCLLVVTGAAPQSEVMCLR